MAAGLGFKTFTTGEVLTAADTNGYLMQGVLVFASSAARAAAITSPQEGQYSYLKDTNSTEYYDGAAWIAAPIGDITGVTAGTGISGGGTSGTVTVTNSMATAIDAKGDLIAGTAADTFDRLAVGTNGQTLVANSSTATGLEWQTPASGGMTLLSTTSLSGASVTVTISTSSYNFLYLQFTGVTYTSGAGNTILELSGGGNSYFDGYTIKGNTVTNVPANSACNFGDQGSGETGGGAFFIYGNLSGGFKTWQSMWRASGFSHENTSGAISLTSAITSFKITNSGYTLSGGTLKIYGGN